MLRGTPIGRTERAAKSLEEKLSRNRETLAEASELRAHLALVTVAKSVQPDMVPLRTREELEDCIGRLLRANIKLPDVTFAALLAREAKDLRRVVQDNPSEGAMKNFLHCVLPWAPHGAQPGEEFDPLHPKVYLSTVRKAERVSFFETHVVSKFLVPHILEEDSNEGAAKSLKLFMSDMMNICINVDMLVLSGAEAKLKTTMEDICQALFALFTPMHKCIPYTKVQIHGRYVSKSGGWVLL